MRTKNQASRDRLYAVLAREGTLGAATLATRVGVSVATLHRLLAEAGSHVVVAGRARRARYALRRPLRGNLADLQLLEIDDLPVAQSSGQNDAAMCRRRQVPSLSCAVFHYFVALHIPWYSCF